MNLDAMFIGTSAEAQGIKKEILKLAKTQKHVLLVGEPGTGKKLLAQILHKSSGGKGSMTVFNPYIVLDNELRSIVEQGTDSSTLLFHDIEDFSFLQQSIILQILENLPKRPFVRVIVTAKEPLVRLKKSRRLTEELLESLMTFDQATVPPLNDRDDDIPVLVEHFIDQAAKNTGRESKVLDINTMDFLIRRAWKRNVAELRSVIESAMLNSDGVQLQLPENLVDEFAQVEGLLKNIKAKKKFAFDQSLSNLEKTLILRTLEVAAFNQTRAAEILGISDANFRYRLKKFRIKHPKP